MWIAWNISQSGISQSPHLIFASILCYFSRIISTDWHIVARSLVLVVHRLICIELVRKQSVEPIFITDFLSHFLHSDQSHLNLFASRPQPKKKRKSRTAFTNTQIFELEKRFIYQKYLSPADRDEIAASLGLSNAQVSFKSSRAIHFIQFIHLTCADFNCSLLLAGDHMVPKSAGQAQARHGRAEKGCGNGEGAVHTQNILGKCSRSRYFEEEDHSWFRHIARTARQSRMKCNDAS